MNADNYKNKNRINRIFRFRKTQFPSCQRRGGTVGDGVVGGLPSALIPQIEPPSTPREARITRRQGAKKNKTIIEPPRSPSTPRETRAGATSRPLFLCVQTITASPEFLYHIGR
jgi:hypothetical protein